LVPVTFSVKPTLPAVAEDGERDDAIGALCAALHAALQETIITPAIRSNFLWSNFFTLHLGNE
jgi:hypothetical protein